MAHFHSIHKELRQNGTSESLEGTCFLLDLIPRLNSLMNFNATQSSVQDRAFHAISLGPARFMRDQLIDTGSTSSVLTRIVA
eukprot:1160538-Pelagomonas_calceolata.AAC.3